jgi:hypothetical protein
VVVAFAKANPNVMRHSSISLVGIAAANPLVEAGSVVEVGA